MEPHTKIQVKFTLVDAIINHEGSLDSLYFYLDMFEYIVVP